MLILSGTFEQLPVYSGLALALFIALSLPTIFRLRHLPTDRAQAYRAPFYPLLPATLVAGAFLIVLYSLIQRPAESMLWRRHRSQWNSPLL